jgi:hypothetical protein
MQLNPQDRLYSLGIQPHRFYYDLQLIHMLLVIFWCPCPAFWCDISVAFAWSLSGGLPKMETYPKREGSPRKTKRRGLFV